MRTQCKNIPIYLGFIDKFRDWWFASTAVPLFAATFGPLANVLSIAALITNWRLDLIDPSNPGTLFTELTATPIHDPHW
jgi:potassium channel subfamily K